MKKYKTLILTILGIVALLVVISLAGGYDDKPEIAQPKEKTAANEPEKPKEVTLDITPDQFKSQFNDAALAGGYDYEIDSILLKSGEVNDVANYKLNNISALVIAASKNGFVKDVTSISVGDGTPQSGLSMFELSVVLIRTFNTNISKQQANKTAMDLFTKVVKEGDKGMSSKTIDNIKYTAMFSEVTGYWFSVSPVKVDSTLRTD